MSVVATISRSENWIAELLEAIADSAPSGGRVSRLRSARLVVAALLVRAGVSPARVSGRLPGLEMAYFPAELARLMDEPVAAEWFVTTLSALDGDFTRRIAAVTPRVKRVAVPV